jgi:hypothetical protein
MTAAKADQQLIAETIAEVEQLLADFQIYFSGKGWTREEIALELEEIAATLPALTLVLVLVPLVLPPVLVLLIFVI